MLTRGIFVTGTDTGVGKTYVSALLMSLLKQQASTVYFKPVQTGFEEDDDTETVVRLANLKDDECCIPVYRLKAPMSPDRAAEKEGVSIEPRHILDVFKSLRDSFVIAEGAGGIEVPLSAEWRMSRIIRAINFPVVIVASTRLGTINHTLLTVEKAKSLGLNVLGVVLNGPEDPGLQEVLEREGVNILFHLPIVEPAVDNPVESVSRIFKKFSDSVFALKDKADAHFEKSRISYKDTEYVWHPFTQHATENNFPVISTGTGSMLKFENGDEALDAISSWWVNLHGHGHTEIAAAITRQASRLEHAVFAGYTHAPAVNLAESLVTEAQKINEDIQKCFFSDNGSTAVEVALKMAYQFHQQKGDMNRSRFLALSGAYHGDTLGAMSVSEREGFHQVFQPLMAPVDFITPDDFSQLEKMRSRFRKYAACIVEPLLQGAGGMKIYSADYLKQLAKMCREEGVLLVADEIFTGFYRTGQFFSSELAGISPDLICLSKGITGGFLPLAATLASQSLFEIFKGETKAKAFLHGHSYTANPVACAAANASFSILKSQKCQDQIRQLSLWTKEALADIAELSLVESTRSLGTVGAFNVKNQDGYMSGDFAKKFSAACLRRGVLLRPLGDVVYTVPPYSTTEAQFKHMYRAIKDSLLDFERGLI